MVRMRAWLVNVGQGSCTILASPTGRVTVIDGGVEAVDPNGVRDPGCPTDPVAFMRRMGVERIDHLVLSHLHRDHSQGLLRIAAEFPVRRAHLPYPRFTSPFGRSPFGPPCFRRNAHVDSAPGQWQLVREYLELLDLLERTGTPIHHPDEHRGAPLWVEPGVRLVQLFPDRGTPPFATPAWLAGLADSDDAALPGLLHDVSETTNAESAVHALEFDDQDTPTLLVGGDLSGLPGAEDPWAGVLDATDLNGCIWVLPHHGAPDGASADHVRRVRPRALVASVSEHTAAGYRRHWDALESAAGTPVLTTFAGAEQSGPAAIEAGQLTVIVGA